MAVTVLGIGLVINGVALNEAIHKGNIVLCKPKISRAKLLETLAYKPPCLIGSCSSAYFWVRTLKK
jgi:transposase